MAIGSALSGVVAGLCAGVIGMALTRIPAGRGAAVLWGAVLAGVAWMVGDVLADSAPDLAWKQIALAIMYTGTIAVPPLWWTVVVHWAEDVEPTRPRTPRLWIRIPIYWSVLMWIVMLTNPWHGAFIEPALGSGQNVYHVLWFFMAGPAFVLGIATLALEVNVLQRTQRSAVRRQALLLMGSGFVALGGNLTYVTGIAPFNPTVLTLSLAGVLLVVGIARDGLFGAVPVALSAIVANDPDGVVVTGADGHIEFANTRAEELMSPIALRRDVSFTSLLRDARLEPQSVLDLAEAPEQTWWNVLAGLHGLLFQVDSERMGGSGDRALHVHASALRSRRGRLRGWALRISERSPARSAPS